MPSIVLGLVSFIFAGHGHQIFSSDLQKEVTGTTQALDAALSMQSHNRASISGVPNPLNGLAILLLALHPAAAFNPSGSLRLGATQATVFNARNSVSCRFPSSSMNIAVAELPTITNGTFEHQGFRCAYRRKAAAPGYEKNPPIMLIHPIGIGLSSWFWDKFLEAWSGSELFVPDLIGCGESAVWDPSDKGLFLPLDYVRQLGTLWSKEIRRPMVVMSQGGLAPLAVLLAARANEDFRGDRAVCGVVLASPPTWSEMVNVFDDKEVENNYRQLSSPLGLLGYRVLLSRFFIRFFSEVFLFASNKADDRWLDEACARATMDVRWPIIAFNAGLVGLPSLLTELTQVIKQPTLVLSGDTDRRSADRTGYADGMADCQLEELPGQNVLPWESPAETCKRVAAFVNALPESSVDRFWQR